MTLIKYRVFRKVAETGSFTKAALELNMTQSAVSHAIASLEKDMGFALFKRNKNKIDLTNEGESILVHVNALVSAECKLINEINALNNIEAGLIRIGSFSSASCRLLPPIIKAFEKKHPNINVEVMEGGYTDIQKWLASGEIDAAFLVEEFLDKSHYAMPFFQDEMLVLVPDKYSSDVGDHFDIRQIEKFPFIMPDNVCNRYLNNLFSHYKSYPNIKYRIQLNSTVFSMIEQGLGISIVAESTLFRSKYDFKTLPLKERVFRQIYLTTNTAEIESPVLKAFFEVAKEVKVS